jgi:hypothetical protein
LFITAFFLGLIAMCFVFGVGILAVPVAFIGVAVIGLAEFRRRRQQSDSVHRFHRHAQHEEIEFTERDKETLVSE